MKDEEQKLKVLCPYCSTPFDADMEQALEICEGCQSCGVDTAKIDITCTNCGKVAYSKEIYISIGGGDV